MKTSPALESIYLMNCSLF